MDRRQIVQEIWAEIPGFPDYAVSSHGKVKNLRFDKELKQQTTSYGAKQVILRRNGKSYCRLVHRLVAECFVSGFRPDRNIRHHNDDNGDNFVENLRFKEGVGLGRYLDQHEPIRVRRILVTDTGQIFRSVLDAARFFNCDVSTIYKVLRGERPHHLGHQFEYYEEE